MIRNAWHFYYALIFLIKVVCGGIGIALLTPEQGVSTGLTSKVTSSGVYLFWRSNLHLSVSAFHVLSGGTICGVFALISSFTVSNS